MTITDEILAKVKTYGSRNYPVTYMLTLLKHLIDLKDFKDLTNEFSDPLSPLWDAWHQGNIEHEEQVDQYLEEALEKPGEGAHDVAKALHFRRKNRDLDEMKKELFGL